AARERNIDTASAAPTINAPARPARMRPTVASTSASWLQLVKMSKQRLKTSINDGNRNGGKNSEAICQRPARTTKGRTWKSPRRPIMPRPPPPPAARSPAWSFHWSIVDRGCRRVRWQKSDRLAGIVDRLDLLADVRRGADVHAQPVVGA